MKKAKSKEKIIYKDEMVRKNSTIVVAIGTIYLLGFLVSVLCFNTVESKSIWMNMNILASICIVWYNCTILGTFVICVKFYNREYKKGVLFELILGICIFLIPCINFVANKSLSIIGIFSFIVSILLMIHSIKQLVNIQEKNKIAKKH